MEAVIKVKPEKAAAPVTIRQGSVEATKSPPQRGQGETRLIELLQDVGVGFGGAVDDGAGI